MGSMRKIRTLSQLIVTVGATCHGSKIYVFYREKVKKTLAFFIGFCTMKIDLSLPHTTLSFMEFVESGCSVLIHVAMLY